MKPLHVFEAFAGYGSQSIALELLSQSFPQFSFEVVGFSEIDKFAIQAYRAIHGDSIPNLGDISKIDWSDFNDSIDLFTYSFPCQDISSAGLQRGFAKGSGSRSSLLWECARAIEAKMPKFLLMENVKALTQKKFSMEFRKWREWLVTRGYANYFAILNAKDYGVPQNRERVFMVSFLGDHAPFSFPKKTPLEKRLKHIMQDEVEDKYWLTPTQIKRIIEYNERKQSEGCGFKTNFQSGEGISGAVTTKMGSREGDTYVMIPVYGNSRLNKMIERGDIAPNETAFVDAYNRRVDGEVAGTLCAQSIASSHYLVSDPKVVVVGNYSPSSHEASRVVSPEGIAPTIKENHGTVAAVMLQRAHGFNKGAVREVCPAITTSNWQDNNFLITDYWIRKLTPRECFRLMDVPERYIDRLLASGISNSQLYKLAGNSIVVSCLYHIFRKMFIDVSAEANAPKTIFYHPTLF